MKIKILIFCVIALFFLFGMAYCEINKEKVIELSELEILNTSNFVPVNESLFGFQKPTLITQEYSILVYVPDFIWNDKKPYAVGILSGYWFEFSFPIIFNMSYNGSYHYREYNNYSEFPEDNDCINKEETHCFIKYEKVVIDE